MVTGLKARLFLAVVVVVVVLGTFAPNRLRCRQGKGIELSKRWVNQIVCRTDRQGKNH
jgi:hypothetical protein